MTEKRILKAGEAAKYIGMSYQKFIEIRKSGEFPVKPVPFFKDPRFDRDAIDAWLDRIAGIDRIGGEFTENILIARARENGQVQN